MGPIGGGLLAVLFLTVKQEGCNGQPGKVLFLKPSQEAFFGGEETLYVTANEKYFMLPVVQAEAPKEIKKALAKMLEEATEKLKAGRFQQTSRGEYMRATAAQPLVDAMEECRELKGMLLDIKDPASANVTAQLLPTAKKVWQSIVQTSANTYFLSDGSPLPHFIGKTMAKQKQGIITSCPAYDIENTQFTQQDCKSPLPSVCKSHYPPHHLNHMAFLEREASIIGKKVKSQLQVKELPPPPKTSETNTSIDSRLQDLWHDQLGDRDVRLGSMFPEDLQKAVDKIRRNLESITDNFQVVTHLFNSQRPGPSGETKEEGHKGARSRIGGADLFYRAPNVWVRVKLGTRPQNWTRYVTKPLILAGLVPIISKVVYIDRKGETCKRRPEGAIGQFSQLLVEDRCCNSLLRHKSQSRCKFRAADERDDFSITLTEKEARDLTEPNNSLCILRQEEQRKAGPVEKGNVLVVTHKGARIESTCQIGSRSLDKGSTLLRTSPGNTACGTRIGEKILGRVLEVIQIVGSEWVNPEGKENTFLHSWPGYLSLGISALCLTVLTVVTAVGEWQRKKGHQANQANQGPRQPDNPVNSIKLKPILKVRTTRSPTPSSSSNSDPWEDDYD